MHAVTIIDSVWIIIILQGDIGMPGNKGLPGGFGSRVCRV